MARHFKKNNYIIDSDSDEDVSNSSTSETESLSDSSLKSSMSNDSNSSSVLNNSSSDSHILPTENPPVTMDKKSSTSKFNDSVEKSISIVSNKSEVKEDCNANDLYMKKLETSVQSVINETINSESNDILVSDSSISMDSKIIMDCSHSKINYDLEKTPFRIEDSYSEPRVVEESSDSDASVQCIESHSCAAALNSDTSVSSLGPNNNSSVEAIPSETLPLNNHESKGDIEYLQTINNTLSSSDISYVSQASVQSIDEYKALERQLNDKKTAYQNILRAIKYCDPKKLKDGGKLLKEKLTKIKEEVDELKKRLENFGEIASNNSGKKFSNELDSLLSTSDQMTANLGKKGLETHRVQQALTVDALLTLCNSFETCPNENIRERDPNGLNVSLMPHQKYALAWLLWREKQTPSGGILADDMGLGKTLTMIALVLRSNEIMKSKNEVEDNSSFVVNDVRMYCGKTLVVCPSSLIGQWQGQIKQHCKPHILSSLVHHGKPRELQAKKLAIYDIVITSYGVIVEENKIIKDNKKGALFRVKWKRIIIDEGHVIRNYKTKTAQALCELEAKYRWCLTGTPVQNKELDMYSLLKFLRCSPFDELSVWKRWVDNKSANGVKRLNTVVKSILLRRTKEELKTIGELDELPKKTLIPVYIKLDEEEQKVYHTVLHFSKSLLADFILQEQRKLGFVSDELKSKHHNLLNLVNEIKTFEIFVLLLRLRQICCLPGLIHSMLEKESCAEDGIDVEDDPILQDLTSQMKRMSVAPTSNELKENESREKILIKSNPVFNIHRLSTKIKEVIKIVKESLDAGDKIVIVSQWACLLQKLKPHILSLKTGVVTLDGSVAVKFRPKIIDDFNNSNSKIQVMLLSLTAGGVGLNLIGGNRLIIFEPHWNPQLESQACDRIYRVGQKKSVYIYKIICQNTIEERIELLQKKKLEVADTVLKGELKLNRTKMTLADLKILFDIHEK